MTLLQIQEPIIATTDENEEIVVGIDLGTTNSLIGIYDNNNIKFFSDKRGNNMIKSRVVYDEKGDLIGVGGDITGHYEISSIKRLMGKNFSDLANNPLNNHSYHNLINDNSQSKEAISLQIADKKISAVEISAEILKYLKKIAEDNLQKSVNKAVITVPAYFDDNAKNATKQSAQLAGLEVIRLVNEPTAGALAFGLDNKQSEAGLYLVYDLGGGTFDVSILQIKSGVFKVLGVSGDNNLGGDDIDEILRLKNYHNPQEIKEKLSFQESYQGLSRVDFEALIADIIKRTINITQNLINDLEIDVAKIDGIILIGGSTRIPLIKNNLAKIFGGDKIITNLDPDRIVAMGACYQAYNLSHKKNNLLLDVNPLSLGIEMMGGIVDKIIHRNSTIPSAKTKEFTTYADNQTGMKFHVVQGEREFAKDCRSLAEFEVKNIPAMKAGLARIRITFKLDADGLLTINSEEKFTGAKQEIIVRPSFGLDEMQVKNILLESLKNSKNDMENRLLAEAIVEASHDIDIITKDLTNPQIILTITEKNAIKDAVQKLRELILTKSKRDDIINAQKNLTKCAEGLILQKVNKVLNQKITGKNIDEIT